LTKENICGGKGELVGLDPGLRWHMKGGHSMDLSLQSALLQSQIC